MPRTREILNPGTLRDQITWQTKNVIGQDTYGHDILGDPPHRDVVTCMCRVSGMQGRELIAAQQIWADARYRIRQHYYKGLKPDMQIAWFVDGEVRLLDVLDIQPAGDMHQMQVIYAKDHVE